MGLVILASAIQFLVGGALAMGLIFGLSALTGYKITETNNSVIIALWLTYCASIFASIILLIYQYSKEAASTHYLWLLLPWMVIVAIYGYIELCVEKIN
ncbi:hypothetical protein [Shewanella japonica]|uniref:hypothetical protein n=1 Tax=Shewanella japonica TaxID=93973 RepID=UPI00249492A4|nr:hypothetical protein [Shewanella japonica]